MKVFKKFLEIWSGFMSIMAIILIAVYISTVYGSTIATVIAALLMGSLGCLFIAFVAVEEEKEKK